MFYLITTLIFATLSLLTIAVCFYALKRINQYELIILNINNTIETINHQLKLIDDMGHFEADDEVGFFFDELKQLGTQLEELFETEEVDDDTQEKKEE